MNHGLDTIVVKKILDTLLSFPQVEKAILYGSRAKGNYKPGSDIDLTLTGTDLNLDVMNTLALALDDLLLPYRFDLSILSHIKNDELLDHIRRVGLEFYSRPKT